VPVQVSDYRSTKAAVLHVLQQLCKRRQSVFNMLMLWGALINVIKPAAAPLAVNSVQVTLAQKCSIARVISTCTCFALLPVVWSRQKQRQQLAKFVCMLAAMLTTAFLQ
jgi:hypothetical protein